jgi:hypothetical protein
MIPVRSSSSTLALPLGEGPAVVLRSAVRTIKKPPAVSPWTSAFSGFSDENVEN